MNENKMLEDFKYNVAKNWNLIERKLNKSLELNNDELIRINNRIDLLNKRLGETNNIDTDDIRLYIEKWMNELGKKNNLTIEQLEQQNAKLTNQIDSLK